MPAGDQILTVISRAGAAQAVQLADRPVLGQQHRKHDSPDRSVGHPVSSAISERELAITPPPPPPSFPPLDDQSNGVRTHQMRRRSRNDAIENDDGIFRIRISSAPGPHSPMPTKLDG